MRIDPANNHSYLTPALGISRADGQFDITWTAGEPVRPDPYLVWLDVNALGDGAPAPPASREPRGHLRMVRE